MQSFTEEDFAAEFADLEFDDEAEEAANQQMADAEAAFVDNGCV